MSSEMFSIIFRGDIVPGYALTDVKQRLTTLFKVDKAQVDRLFTGKPITLKQSLSEGEAQKYCLLLKKVGIVVFAEAVIDSDNTSVSSKVERSMYAAPASEQWALAPLGSQLVEQQPSSAAEPVIHTEHLSLAKAEGNLLADAERTPVEAPALNTGWLEWALSPQGGASLLDVGRQAADNIEVDSSHLSLADAQGHLLREDEKMADQAVDIDMGHLQILPMK